MNWFQNAWQFLKKLPVGRWLGSLLKPAVTAAIQKEGDRLQADAVAAIRGGCPQKLDAIFDRWQVGMLKAVDLLPTAVRPKARQLIQEEGDRLQTRVKDAACEGGLAGVNAAFDGFQALLIKRIEAL